MAKLRKQPNGKYYAYFYDSRKKPTRKSYPLRVGLKSAAEKMLRRLEAEYADGSFDPWAPRGVEVGLSFSAAAERFLKEKDHLRPKSRQAYLTNLSAVEDLLPESLPLSQVDPMVLREFVYSPRVSSATQEHRHRHLAVFFRWASKRGFLTHNLYEAVQKPRPSRKEAIYLKPAELSLVIEAIRHDEEGRTGSAAGQRWLSDLVILAVNTGMRRGELRALRWIDVDLPSRFIRVRSSAEFRTKSGNDRSVPISAEAAKLLARRSALDFPWVLTNKNGRQIDSSYASKRFKHYCRQVGLREEIHFHSLRHTCASWLVSRGAPIAVVQRVMGHRQIQTTMQYAHLAPETILSAFDEAMPAFG